MSIPEPSELKELRESAGIELTELAKITSLSVQQLKQLEEGGENLFYSPEIKQQAIKRVLKAIAPQRIFEQPEVLTDPSAENPISHQPKNVIDEIVRLSNKGGKAKNIFPSPVYTKKRPTPMAMGAVVIFIGIVVLYVSPWDTKTKETSTEIVQPILKDTSQSSVISSDTVSDLNTKTSSFESAQQKSDSLTDSKIQILSSAKNTVDNGIKAVGTTLATASDVVKNTAPLATNTTTTSSPAPAADLSTKAPSPGSLATSVTTISPQPKSKLDEPKSDNTNASNSAQSLGDTCQLLAPDTPQASAAYASSASKSGNYVYLTTNTDKAEACVQDGSGKKTPVTLAKNQGISVYGSGPWNVASPDFSKMQIYFQGSRIMPTNNSGKRMQLVEQSINQ